MASIRKRIYLKMSLEARLERCKAYREEALRHPIKNKLYIEDLELSIAMFEQAIKQSTIRSGRLDSEEESV